MLIIAGSFRIDATKRDDTVAVACEMMADTLKEKGCHAYSFTFDLADPAVMHLYERWESDDDLRAHFSTPHMAKFQGALPKLSLQVIGIHKFEISKMGPVR